MADLEEEKFRIEFEKVARKFGWSAYHVTGSDGIHDELMFKGYLGLTVELKSVKPIKINRSLRNDFKATQMPFYLRQSSDSRTPTVIAVKYLGDIDYYGVYVLDSQKEIIDFFSKKWKSLLESGYIHSSIESIIQVLEKVYVMEKTYASR
jgi:hypothetical protein